MTLSIDGQAGGVSSRLTNLSAPARPAAMQAKPKEWMIRGPANWKGK
jgi:hypothetical protein